MTEAERFESTLESGERLAIAFREYTQTSSDLLTAEIQLAEAQDRVEQASQAKRAAAAAYDDAKLALIGSVEAL
jgi:hypothetical protein